jgi:sn-glycerol 3-phosphate transport system substrate-binding protein
MVIRGLSRTALLLASLLAMPAAAQTTPAPTTISFYSYNLASAGMGGAATRQLLDEFMAANPAIKVDGVPVPADQMMARVQADIVAGHVPDVAQLIFSDLDFIVGNLGVKALGDIVPPAEWAEHTAGMVPAGLKLGEINGKTYGLAFTFSTPVLFYNATLFRAAGLDPERPPRNWDEVKQAALAIKAQTGKPGFYPSVYSGFDWLLQSLVLSNGGRVLSEDRKRLMFGEADSVAAIATMRDLVVSGAQPNLADADAHDAMAAGNLGMVLTTSVYTRVLLNASKDKWELRAAPMPSFGDKPTAPVNSGSALFILAADPAKQLASWELMKFLTSKRGYTIITSKIGYLPLRLDIVADPNYLGPWVEENPLVRPNLEQLTRLNQWQSFPGANYKQINKIEVAAVNEAVYGKGDVATVMREAQARAQTLMPR